MYDVISYGIGVTNLSSPCYMYSNTFYLVEFISTVRYCLYRYV